MKKTTDGLKVVEKRGYTLYKRGNKIFGWLKNLSYGFGSPFSSSYVQFTSDTQENALSHMLESLATTI